MSNIWILTIGNRDVQLKKSGIHRWNVLSRNLPHEFGEENREKDMLLVPARAMGMAISEDLGDPIHEHLCFPLLDNFSQKLEQKDINQIIVLLTDQRFIREDCQGGDPGLDSPYWEDTCTLKPTINKYLKSKFPQSEIDFVTIQPKSESESLNSSSWDQVAKLITNELFNPLGQGQVDDIDDIYVSYQAGTPAVSFAVQFLSLSRFGKKVKYLVSNEKEGAVINVSNYFI